MYMFFTLIGLAMLAAVGFACLPLYARFHQEPVKANGEWFAEVWLDWGVFGRGSTLYRQRFSTKTRAYLAVRFYAWLLDQVLPTHYQAEFSDGGHYWERYDYGISYGVLKVAETQQARFSPIWSAVLPGHTGHRGEHAVAHPIFGDSPVELSGSLEGYTL